MIAELDDALMSAGAPGEKARKAPEAIAGRECRFATIETDLPVIKWMLGFVVAINVAILARLFLQA